MLKAGELTSRNSNQADLLHHKAQAANWVSQKNSWKINCLDCSVTADKTRHIDTDEYPAAAVIRGCPTGKPAKQSLLGARLNGTRSSWSVINAAPPAAIVPCISRPVSHSFITPWHVAAVHGDTLPAVSDHYSLSRIWHQKWPKQHPKIHKSSARIVLFNSVSWWMHEVMPKNITTIFT